MWVGIDRGGLEVAALEVDRLDVVAGMAGSIDLRTETSLVIASNYRANISEL